MFCIFDAIISGENQINNFLVRRTKKKIHSLIISKEHLTESGKTLIKTIESNMNSKRYK